MRLRRVLLNCCFSMSSRDVIGCFRGFRAWQKFCDGLDREMLSGIWDRMKFPHQRIKANHVHLLYQFPVYAYSHFKTYFNVQSIITCKFRKQYLQNLPLYCAVCDIHRGDTCTNTYRAGSGNSLFIDISYLAIQGEKNPSRRSQLWSLYLLLIVLLKC